MSAHVPNLRALGVAAPASFPRFALPLGIILFLTVGLGPNYHLAALSCFVLVVGLMLLWRPGEPPILLYIFGIHWLQGSLNVFIANQQDVALTDLVAFNPLVETAATLVLVSTLMLAVGFRLGAGRFTADYLLRTRSLLEAPDAMVKWTKIYLASVGLSFASLAIAVAVPGLSQLMLGLAGVKWAAFLVLTAVAFYNPAQPKTMWFVVFAFEFLFSLGGFFASYKVVFIVAGMGMFAASVRLSAGRAFAGAMIAGGVVVFSLYWTAIKLEYRGYASDGRNDQTVSRSYSDGVAKIVDLLSEVDSDALSRAAVALSQRISEIDFFGAVLGHVPAVVDHEYGALWADAISRPFMPRLFFPNKAVIDESEITIRYSGIMVAGMGQGTQISIGYIAESYVDFGYVGMLPAIFFLGVCLGFLHRKLREHPNGSGLLGVSLSTTALIQMESVATSSAKLVGGIVVSYIAALLILRFIAPRFLKTSIS